MGATGCYKFPWLQFFATWFNHNIEFYWHSAGGWKVYLLSCPQMAVLKLQSLVPPTNNCLWRGFRERFFNVKAVRFYLVSYGMKSDTKVYFLSLPRLSHLAKLHLRVWMEGPVQGLLVASHERPLCWVPVPQVTVHSVHSDQGDQPSSLPTADSKRKVASKCDVHLIYNLEK